MHQFVPCGMPKQSSVSFGPETGALTSIILFYTISGVTERVCAAFLLPGFKQAKSWWIVWLFWALELIQG